MGQFHIAQRGEHQAGDVLRAAHPGGAVGKRTGVRLSVADQLTECRYWQVRRNDDHLRCRANNGDWGEIVHRIVRHVASKQIDDVMRRSEIGKQCVTVRR